MGIAARIQWYVNRLRAMSPLEVAFRCKEAAKRRYDAYFSQRLIAQLPEALPYPEFPGLKANVKQWTIPSMLRQEWQAQAKALERGDIFLLGKTWPAVGRDNKWHLDPASSAAWPHKHFCFAINYRHTEVYGDIKYVWELSRLQSLQGLAVLAFCDGDGPLAEKVLAEIESWIRHNPPFKGVHWASGIELALRAVSLVFVATLLSGYASAEQKQMISRTLALHGVWLARYPSKYSSANNHRTAEGLGLFLLGLSMPALAQAPRWQEEGWEMLLETARLQILPDGVGAEQSPNYQAVVVEMLLLGWYLARKSGINVPPLYSERMEKAGEYLRWITDAAGNQPRIGDDDNARVIGVYTYEETYVRDILGRLSAMTGRADLAPPHTGPHLRALLFGEPMAHLPAPSGVRHFEQGGYTVARHAMAGREMMLVMDHGPLGYLSIAAHGHADALALWLHLDGQPVFVDAGTYLYHSGGDWRRHFRSTRAHNTLAIAGSDSSVMSGHFNWSHKAAARLTASEVDGAQWWIEAEQDGYQERYGVIHRRRLEVHPAKGLTLRDSLIGEGTHEVEIGFLLHPSLLLTEKEGEVRVRRNAETLLLLQHRGALLPVLGAPETAEGGWYSPTFGEKIPCWRLAYRGRLKAGDVAETHLAIEPRDG